MAFKLQRRDSDSANVPDAEPERKESSKPQKKYSVATYIYILFAVVLVIVLLSYFIQQRNNSQALLSLREQHDQVTNQAFENIEKLQDLNTQLMKENAGLKDEIDALSDADTEKAGKLDALSEENDALSKENKVYKDFIALQSALHSRDAEKAKALIDTLEREKADIPPEQSQLLETLKTSYNELLAEIEAENTENEEKGE